MLNIQEQLREFAEKEPLKCKKCGEVIEAGSFCESCQKRIGKSGGLSNDELFGTKRANQPHPKNNKRVI